MFPKRSDAILEVRQRADMENDQFVRDPELVRLMNHNIRSIYKDCITAFGNATFVQRFVISGLGPSGASAVMWPNTAKTGAPTQIETTEYPLPTNFSRLLRCDWCPGNTLEYNNGTGLYYVIAQNNISWTPMNPIDLQGMVYDGTPREWQDGRVQYWLKTHPGSYTAAEHAPTDTSTVWWIAFLPPPQAISSVSIFYTPIAPVYTDQDEQSLVHLPDEAWIFVVNATAADMLEKKDKDAKVLRIGAANARSEIVTGDLAPDHANARGTVDIGGGNSWRRNVWGH